MSWLVTGGSGFLGVHLLRHLVAQGVSARSLDLVPGAPAGVEELVGDVADPQLLRQALDGVEVVVHAAAALPSGGDLHATNVTATRQLAAHARSAGVARSILVSSAVVYGRARSPIREDDQTRPIEAYGRSKLAAERAWLGDAPCPLVLRPTAFVGPERLGIFGILFRWIREGRRIYVLGDGSNRYQLLDVQDLVTAVVLAAGNDDTEVVNLGGIVTGTVRDDLGELVAHAGTRSRVVGVPARPARLGLAALAALRLSPLSAWHIESAGRDFVLDCGRARRTLGWTPSRSGVEALCAAYDWFLEAGVTKPLGTTHRTAWRERGLAALRRIS